MTYLLDTNILMNTPEILEKDNRDFVVSSITLEELDYKKDSKDGETAYKARRATHYLLKYFDKWKFQVRAREYKLADDDIIDLAHEKNYTIITNDLLMALQAKLLKVNCEIYNNDAINYSGVQYYTTELDEVKYNKELDDMLNGKLPEHIKLAENEFLVVSDQEGNNLVIFQWRYGELRVVKDKYIKNIYINSIAGRNEEQRCLISLLFNKNISIICASGGFGTGKTFLTLNYALQELEKGAISKLVFVPNNAFVDNSREHGFEPGTSLEKELAFLGTIIDILGEARTTRMISEGQIEVVPLATMRGRNFDNSIILVNEAQNLTEDHIKLLIGRVGDKSRIIFDGDEKQADSSLFKNKNGLKLLARLKDSELFAPIFGMIKLKKVERSFTAQAADYLDTL